MNANSQPLSYETPLNLGVTALFDLAAKLVTGIKRVTNPTFLKQAISLKGCQFARAIKGVMQDFNSIFTLKGEPAQQGDMIKAAAEPEHLSSRLKNRAVRLLRLDR